MKEKPPLLYDVVYPKDFNEKIKRTGKYDVLDLARKGMVLCFEIILPKEKIDEGLKQVASMFHRPEYEYGGVILCDIDEWVENANTAFKFAKETGKFGELPLRLFLSLLCEDQGHRSFRWELLIIASSAHQHPIFPYI